MTKPPATKPESAESRIGVYRIERELGRGGMGVVFAAVHEGLQERVAIKVLQLPDGEETDVTRRDELRTRFVREAQVSATLRGDQAVRVTDVAMLNDGTPYMVMEYVDGKTLAQTVAKGAIAPARAAEIVAQICEGIAEAHAHGIVHRDLKPSNVMLAERPDGSLLVKILDFGVSKRSGDADDERSRAHLLGSPRYSAPEQLEDPSSVDARADVWSIGAILAECVSGTPLFTGNEIAEIVANILSSAPRAKLKVRRAGVNDALAETVSGALTHDREARTPDVARLAEDALRSVGANGTDTRVRAIRHVLANGDPFVASSARRRIVAPPSKKRSEDASSERPGPVRQRWIPLAAVVALLCVGAIAFALVPRGGSGPVEVTNESPPAPISPEKGAPKETTGATATATATTTTETPTTAEAPPTPTSTSIAPSAAPTTATVAAPRRPTEHVAAPAFQHRAPSATPAASAATSPAVGPTPTPVAPSRPTSDAFSERQ